MQAENRGWQLRPTCGCFFFLWFVALMLNFDLRIIRLFPTLIQQALTARFNGHPHFCLYIYYLKFCPLFPVFATLNQFLVFHLFKLPFPIKRPFPHFFDTFCQFEFLYSYFFAVCCFFSTFLPPVTIFLSLLTPFCPLFTHFCHFIEAFGPFLPPVKWLFTHFGLLFPISSTFLPFYANFAPLCPFLPLFCSSLPILVTFHTFLQCFAAFWPFLWPFNLFLSPL